MEQREFIAWLEGFLHDKVKLGISDIELIKNKIFEATPTGHTIGYYPDPYLYPGMIGVDKVKNEVKISSTRELLDDMKIVAKDIDITNVGDDGIHISDSFGESHFLTWDQVHVFVEDLKTSLNG